MGNKYRSIRFSVRLVIVALFWTLPVAAQQAGRQVDPSVPSGNPVDPTLGAGRGQGTQGDSRSGDLPQGNAPAIGPRSLGGTTNGPLSLDQLLAARQQETREDGTLIKRPADPGEFEKYLERALGRKLKRYGQDMLLPAARDFATPANATVPPSYLIRPGDKIVISLVGSIDGSVDRVVDSNGRIFLEGVGSIRVAGVRNSDLQDVVSAAIGRQYRGYTVSVRVSELRGIRVYVTGFANNPGAFSVSSLSTLANAVLQAGGPSAGGSFRSVKLYRHGREVADFDLYQLLRGGSRINDLVLENEDVLFIPPAGEQVAIIGSVQDEAIYEARRGESLTDILAAAGGPNTLADPSRLILYRTSDDGPIGPRQLSLGDAAGIAVRAGDILQLLSTGSLTPPVDRQSVLVRVEGEVNKPGIYYVAPGTPTGEVLKLAGGLSTAAYPYGTRFTRQSVRLQQQESYREAIRQIELSLAAAPLSADSSQNAGDRQAQLAGARAVVDRLKQSEPDGRVVLAIEPFATTLPTNIALENNDSIIVPPRPTTVGVFGAIYRPASFMLNDRNGLTVKDYVELAGGTLRSADRGAVFVVRSNGEVVSKKRGAWKAKVYAGDVIFVPIKTQGNIFWSRFKDITQTLFQLGLSAATIATVTR